MPHGIRKTETEADLSVLIVNIQSSDQKALIIAGIMG